jgi:hypothetical protein
MKQKSITVKLLDLVGRPFAFGNEDGRDVFRKLQAIVDENPQASTVGISLEGMKATDASFPRESVVALAKSFRGDRGFFLKDVPNRDILDNWSYAATAKEQPLIVYGNGYEIIGVSLTESSRQLFDYIESLDFITTNMVANRFDLSTQNASGRLKKLFMQGLLLGKKEVAESGGHEFIYRPIK